MKNNKIEVWPKDLSLYYIETASIIILAILFITLEYGRLDAAIIFSPQLAVRILGALSIWFANRFTLEYLLQSRLDANKVTKFLPFEMILASITITSVLYILFYPILIYLNNQSFLINRFLQGLLVTSGLSLLIVIFYSGVQIWQSWWSDGEFLFQTRNAGSFPEDSPGIISIKNSKGSVNHDFDEIAYFVSEDKIVLLVDTSGKKSLTQYNLSELEEKLDGRFFRLNRKIIVNRRVINQVIKLPNHRLEVIINLPNERLTETVSRYKSTRFKQWFENS